jgi:membrane-associated protease RseP (regulator of RpoE activity)
MKVRWITVGLAALCLAAPARAAEKKKADPISYRIPYRLTAVHHVLVRVKINGKGPFNFILDTGAPALFVSKAVGKELGIKNDKSGWATFNRFEIEGGVVETKAKGIIETPFQLEGMNALGLAGAKLHGMIGYNLLARYRITYDFSKDRMIWVPLKFNPPLPKRMRGKGGAPGGLDALAGILKVVSMFTGKMPQAAQIPRGFLGVELAVLGKAGGVQIKTVLAKSPAEAAGLKAGDQIHSFQGKKVRTIDDVQRLAAKVRAGKKARFTVNRKGETLTITVTAGEGL